jgi:hypothetical protein
MSAQHTPGPWRIDHARHRRVYQPNDMEIRAGNGLGGSVIATIYAENWDMDGATDRANANLLAAAPDMLAALRAVVAAHDEWTAAVGRDGRFDDPLNDACEHARDLIAKVEGR